MVIIIFLSVAVLILLAFFLDILIKWIKIEKNREVGDNSIPVGELVCLTVLGLLLSIMTMTLLQEAFPDKFSAKKDIEISNVENSIIILGDESDQPSNHK